MSRFRFLFALAAVTGLGIAGLSAGPAARLVLGPGPEPEIAIVAGAYPAQKAVYHISADGGWFGRAHFIRLTNIDNHLAALPAGTEIVAVLHGDGVDLLTEAARSTKLAAKVDALRARGVRFLVCRNTLVSRRIAPEALHGFKTADLVASGVAEIGRLQQAGYVYVKP